MQNISTRDRALYDKVLKMAPQGTIPTLATLREEAVLVNNNGVYTFEFNEQRAGVRKTETLLSIKDAFVANRIGLKLLVERKTKPGSGVLLAFPCQHALVQAGAVSAQDLEAFFNGTLKVQIDQQVMMDRFSTRRFRHVPQTPGIVVAEAFTGPSQSSADDGMVNVEPNLVLRGTKKNTFTLSVPTFDGVAAAWAAVDAAFDVRVVLLLDGFIIPGGAGLNS
ncbi:hypothetical protein Q5H93_02960 [Hymenobacter sp. ASUV-10]|uniref:TldD/PmbA family protein n=1 Tax=Hymenobacter aranciens TaxID=3063996 RepID=A0ABT9B5Y4_9BACT|nr:hypothetical protein [Hymenobacter sp. ASUV-10]MDO7873679.1 hypothetical protein [Hymenobacter sp. ASUV-10]